jgi:hypothetical protein
VTCGESRDLAAIKAAVVQSFGTQAYLYSCWSVLGLRCGRHKRPLLLPP